MRKIIPIAFLMVLLASSAHTFSSPPMLLKKLDVMFEWAKEEMGTPGAKRPPVFISSRQAFLDICKHNTDGTEDYECEEVIGLYFVQSQIIHISEHRYLTTVDSTTIHEMVHFLQHLKYGLVFFVHDSNRKFIEDRADALGRKYIRQKYGIVTR